MKLVRFVAPLLVISGVTQAADISASRKAPVAPVVESDLIYGSIAAGGSFISSPNQHGIKAGTIPYLNLNGKLTYMTAPRGWGAQVDANLAGLSTDWVSPRLRHSSSVYVYGGALHLFTRAVSDAKLGVFFQFDQHQASARNFSVAMPSSVGGLEGQYALNRDLMLYARFGIGSNKLKFNDKLDDGSGKLNLRSYIAGLGLSYRINDNWRAGWDNALSQVRISDKGFRGRMTFLETGPFIEYRPSGIPLTLRAGMSYLHDYDKNFFMARGSSFQGMRAKLGLQYEFGATARRGGDQLDEQFQTYNVLAGLR